MYTEALILLAKPGNASGLIHSSIFPTLECHSSSHRRKKNRDLKIMLLAVMRGFLFFSVQQKSFFFSLVLKKEVGKHTSVFYENTHITEVPLTSANLLKISRVKVDDVVHTIIQNG